MSDNATVTGGQTLSWDFTGSNYTATSNAQFAALYSGTVASYSGTGDVPTSSDSNVLYIAAGTMAAVPTQYVAVYDASTSDTIVGGENASAYFLENNTTLQLSAVDPIVYAKGDDLVMPGSGDTTIYAGTGSVSVSGGTGNLVFYGGTGAASVSGGTGTELLFGSTGTGTTYLQASSGNSTLSGGSGTGATTMIGGTNTTEFADGTGDVTMVAGTGDSQLNGMTGTGDEIMFTSPISNTGTAVFGLNNAADTVIAGTGQSTIVGGTGDDVFGFVDGHAGGSVVIEGFHTGDNLAFGNYSGWAIASETVVDGSDVMTLTDGTQITFLGVDHKFF
ncbi:calcium-binding protein [Acidisoma silvae]|uniref:Calcium-binding protein n=1 Tax=Acidisoma silvae TaxID=2802396 RepID=A0A963YUD9_9PROT|nr:hypothetical protein [Acidisoma silvae]MCB8876575.1 hypothetical protein [Acidisoma silvae]